MNTSWCSVPIGVVSCSFAAPEQRVLGRHGRWTMRVLHVVNGLASDNRFGGVTQVAIDLARRQRRAGNPSVLAGAGMGYRRVPREIDGVRVLLAKGVNPTPGLGLGSVIAPALLLRLARPMCAADLVHVHLGRDVVSLTSALLARLLGRPLIVQTHGMLDAPRNRLARLIDRVLTRPALRGASLALVLIDLERAEIDRLTLGRLRTESFPNGVNLPQRVIPRKARAEDVVFLARLHPRKGALAFANAAIVLSPQFSNTRFRIIGPDEGDAGPVASLLMEHSSPPSIRLEGAVHHDAALALLAAARVLVLPAIAEPFGMTLIEAMAAGTPVVLHETAVLAPTVVAAGAGTTFGPLCGRTLEAAVALLLDEGVWQDASEAGRELVRDRFSLDSVVDHLRLLYSEVTR